MTHQLFSVASVDFNQFIAAFNEAYSDYIIPLQVESGPMRRLITGQAIDLNASQVVVKDGRIVGVGLVGILDDQAWIGGLGVIPTYRRQGIGRLIMNELLAGAKSRDVSQVKLEVIQGNTGAYLLYKDLGFRVLRNLLILEGSTTIEPDQDIEMRFVPPEEALKHYHDFHTHPNPWQRRFESLIPLREDMDGIIALKNGEVVAYATGWLAGGIIRWMDMAHAPGRADALRSLVAFIHQRNPDVVASMLNLGEDDPAWRVLEPLGYHMTLMQFEMELELN